MLQPRTFFFLNWSIDFYFILFSFDCDSNKGNSLQIKICHLEWSSGSLER